MEARPISLSRPAETAGEPVHILLYALIPTERACTPIARRGWAWLRNRLRRQLELAAWRVLGRWNAHYSTFKDQANTNRGDIAIRMGVKRQLCEAFSGRSLRFTEVAWGELGRALESASRPDLVVIAGGGFLFADKDGRLPRRFAEDVKALEGVDCPVVAASIGLNYLITAKTRQPPQFHPACHNDLERFLGRLALGAVRDENTRRALRLIKPSGLPVIVDPAFLLPSDVPRAPADAREPLSVGVNMAFHGAHTPHTSTRILQMFVGVLKRLQNQMPCRFTYFVHSDAERAIARALKLAGIPLNCVHTDVDGMLAAYRRMDIHIGQMLHSAIMATSVGTPTLNLAYDVKSAGFFHLLGMSSLCLDMSKVDDEEIYTAITSLIAERQAVACALAKRRLELVRESRQFYACVAGLLEPEAVIPAAAPTAFRAPQTLGVALGTV